MDYKDPVETARMTALNDINSIDNIIKEFESGKLEGRLINQLISENRITSALDAIRDYKEIATMYNEKIDNDVINKMNQTKQDLIDILNKNKDNPEVSMITAYLDRMPEFNVIIDSESEYKKVKKSSETPT